MSIYTSRQISEKLRRYAHFLESEVARYEAVAGLIDIDSDAYIGLVHELKETREMQNYLWEAKTTV